MLHLIGARGGEEPEDFETQEKAPPRTGVKRKKMEPVALEVVSTEVVHDDYSHDDRYAIIILGLLQGQILDSG